MTREELRKKRQEIAKNNGYTDFKGKSQNQVVNQQPAEPKVSTWDKVMNIAKSMGTDVGNIGKNFGLGITSSLKNSGYYIQDMTENKFGDYRRYNQQQNAILNKREETEKLTKNQGTVNINNVKLPENPNQRQMVSEEESKKALLPQKQESRVLKSIDESIAKDEEKIQQNIDNSSNRVSKKLAELMPSIAQSVTGMGASVVNPAIGLGFWQTSAGGGYTREAEKNGYTGNQAMLYGTIMGSLESATEYIGAKLASGVGKSAKGLLKALGKEEIKSNLVKALASYGLEVGENFLEEAIMEPTQELVKQATGGEADWNNIWERMKTSGINGALTSIIMGGASAGIGSAVGLVEKSQNGQQITQKEIADTLKEINKSEEVDIEKILANNFNFTAEDLAVNTDARQRTEQRLENVAEGMSRNEAQQLLINESDLDDTQKEVLSEIASQYNLSDEDVKKAIQNTKDGKYNNLEQIEGATTQNNEVLNQEQQTIQDESKMAQNELSTQPSEYTQNLMKSIDNYNNSRQEGQEIFDINNEETRKEIESIQKVAENRGINITFDENRFNNADTNAFYEYDKDGNVANIVLNPNSTSKKYVQNLVIHEMTHSFEGSKEYKNLSKAILDYAKKTGEYDKAFKDLKNTYSSVYKGDNIDSIVEKEAVANILGEKLGDKQFVDSLVNNQYVERSTIQKIIDFAKNQINRFKGYKDQEQYWNYIKTLYEEAYNKSKVSKEGLKNGKLRYSIGGEKSLTANIDKLNEAKKLKEDGKSTVDIYKQTGWYESIDGKWKYEIDDSNFNLKENLIEKDTTYDLEEILDAPELFKAYPKLKEVSVSFDDLGDSTKGEKYSRMGFDYITLNNDLINESASKKDYDLLGIKNQSEVYSTLMHEIQHVIQGYEGFAKGSNIDFWSNTIKDIDRKYEKTQNDYQRFKDEIGLKEYEDKLLQDWKKDKITGKELTQRIDNYIEEKGYTEKFDRLAELQKELLTQKYKLEDTTPGTLYFFTAGELEAREVQNRINKDSEWRKQNLPQENGMAVFVEDFTDKITDSYSSKTTTKDSQGRELSKGQQEYNKDSKTRDKNGNLIPFYHGTYSDFNVFDKDKINSSGAGAYEGFGFNFTPSKARAETYSNGKVKEVYLNITNPLSFNEKTITLDQLANIIETIDPTGDNVISNYAQETRDYGQPSFVKREALNTAKAIYEYSDSDADIYSQISSSGAEPKSTIKAFEDLGYDGVLHYDENGNIKTAITFEPNQAKNIDNLNPTDNPDIRYSQDTTGAWNNFIEKYFKNEGEGTAIKDLKKLPTREYTIQDYEEVINNSANIPEEDKKSILKDLEGIELNKQSLNDFKQYVEDLDNNYKEVAQTQEQQRFENKNYKDEGRANLISEKRKEFNTNMEYDDSVVAELDEIIPRNKNGKRTVAEWKNMAKQLGQRIANLSPEQIEDIAVKSYYDLEPTKAITRYDNRSKTNVGYEQLYANDWVNEVYEGVRENRQFSMETENTPRSMEGDEDLQAIREHHERELGDTIKLDDIQNLPELNQEGKLEGELPKTIDRIVEKRTKEKVTAKEFVKELKKQFVNKGYAVDKLADATKNQKLKYKYDRQLMSFNEAQVSLGDSQVDTNGRVVGKSLNEVFKQADKTGLSKVFADYLENYNNIARDKLGESLYGADVTAVQSRKIVEEYEKKYPQFKEWKEDVSKYNDNLAKTYLVGTFIDDALWGKLKELNQDYVPAFRDITETKGLADSVDNVGFQVLKRAEGGNSNILTPKEAMAEQTLQYVKAFRKNETIKELYKTLKGQLTDTDVIYEGMETVPEIAYDMMKEAIGKDENGNYTATFFDNGKATSFKVSKDIFDSFVQSKAIQEIENNAVTKIIGGTARNIAQFQRNAVTTYSLPFLLKNMVRDYNDALINTKYSDLRFMKNYARAYVELIGKGKLAQQYHNLGGGANTYYEYGKGLLPTSTKNPIKKFMNVVTSMNEVIEQAPRLAEFMSTLETGGSVEEALYNSAEITTNFKRGGDTAKLINKYGANFFNASIQGADKFVRTITGQKGLKGYASLLVKATIAGIAPSMLNHLLISGSDDEEERKAYEDLQDYLKDNYYLFYKGNGEFWRIPKGRISAVLGNTAVKLYKTTQGDDKAFDNYFNNVIIENIAPNNPLTNNIIAPVLQAKENRAWYDGTIYNESKYANKLPVEVTDEKVDWLSNKVAEGVNAIFDDETLMRAKTENSWLDLIANPKKLNYILDQYSGGFGDIIMPMGTPQAENDVFTDQFTTSSVLKNKYINEFYDMLDNNLGKSEYATDFDKLTYKYLNQQSTEIGKLYSEKHQISLDETLSDEEKKEQVKEIQKQINDLAEKSVKTIQETKVNGDTATFDGTTYYKDNEDNWKKIDEDDKIPGIKDTTYANYKNKLSEATQKKREAEGKNDVNLTDKEKNKILLDSTYTDKEKDSIYTETTGKKDGTYQALKIVANPDIDTYLEYKTQTFESLDDPNSNVVGKKVTKGEGTKKNQTINYIRNSNMSTAEQEYLIATEYKLDNKRPLQEYINSLNLSPEEYNTVMSSIASSNVEQLTDGTWRWKK